MQRLKNPTSHTQLLAVIFWHAVKYGLLPAQCLQIEKSQGTLKTLCQFPGWQLCLNWTQEEWFGDPAPFQDWFFWNCYHNHWHLLPNNIVSSRLTLFKKRYFRKVYVCTSKREVCVCVCGVNANVNEDGEAKYLKPNCMTWQGSQKGVESGLGSLVIAEVFK